MQATLTYSLVATNVSGAQLAGAVGNVARDLDTEALLGLALVSDLTGAAGNQVTRTIVYNVGAGPIPAADLADVLTGFYQNVISQGVVAPVLSQPVVVA